MRLATSREGTVHIVWTNRAEHVEPRYRIVFADDVSAPGGMKVKEIIGDPALKSYLTWINVSTIEVYSVLRDLKTQGNAVIFHTVLSDEQLAKLGLK